MEMELNLTHRPVRRRSNVSGATPTRWLIDHSYHCLAFIDICDH